MQQLDLNMANVFVLVSLSIQLLFPFTSFSFTHGATITCHQTPYPELCEPLGTNETRPILHKTLRLTKAHGEQALSLISAMDLSSFDQRARLALADCLELYEDTVHHIHRCISSSSPTNVQTWLSAAFTNLQTCEDGFVDFKLSSHLKSFPLMLSNFTKLLSNSLALNKAIISYSPAVSSGASDGYPEWVSVADRRILRYSRGLPADLVVAQDGLGQYRTINEALNALPARRSGTTRRFVIYVRRGVYRENVEIQINMRNLVLVGDGVGATVVTGNKNLKDGTTTYKSATFVVSGDGFIARGIMFENTAGPEKDAAVALRSSADASIFFECSFKGYQDTLYVHTRRQFYRNCDIYGTVDFIFGDAAAVLQNCNIYVRRPIAQQQNTITAQGRTNPHSNTGIVIHNSRVVAGPDLAPVIGSVKTYLGRPWRQYSRTVYVKCFLGQLIAPEGWLPWNGNFALSTLYYAEYMNFGPGAGTGGRVNWPGYHRAISLAEAEGFSVRRFLDGDSWIPATGVPFTSVI